MSGRYLGKKLGNMMGNLSKKAFLDFAVPLAKDVLFNLATKATSSILDKFEREIIVKVALRAGKEFFLFISNEDMNDIIKIIKLAKDAYVLMLLLKQ